MRLKSVFVRFYKSFNYDYLRKIKASEVHIKPWELIKEQFYPYVEVPIEPTITTIVGANESGKSHLLTAIEKGLLGSSEFTRGDSAIERKDFCRYSHFFKSTVGGPQLPDFGFEWVDIDDVIDRVRTLCKLEPNRHFDRFFIFRNEGKIINFFIPSVNGKEFEKIVVEKLPTDLFPHLFRIASDIALPDNVSISRLLEGPYKKGDMWKPSGREMAFVAAQAMPEMCAYLDKIQSLPQMAQAPQPSIPSFQLPDTLHKEAAELRKSLNLASFPIREDEELRRSMEFNLAYDLIFKIAEIDVLDIELLDSALRKGETGIVRSVVDNVNEALRKRLNFPRVWAQDRMFALRVEATEHELSFIISDRTGRQYSFDERSSGLRHFLSYYIQYLTHEPQGEHEILLMDEPDATLSGEAQQDLLKVFDMFANPAIGNGDKAVPVQVIYVTHSPFLIDKNHAERVRALEKAEGSKGTRVIGGASQNHYEPLRSAFGSFVGETTFISGCNLMVEGPADQILLAGSAAYLRKLEAVPESHLLNLNTITIVPAGGGTNVPYLVYLARGRDAEKPAVIVMLDSDSEGDNAKKDLSHAGPHPRKKQVLDPKFILQLGDIKRSDIEEVRGRIQRTINKDANAEERPFKVLEDLVPLPLAVRAAREFVITVYDLQDTEVNKITEQAVLDHQKANNSSVFASIQAIVKTLTPERTIHMDKVPFARTVVDLLPELSREREGKDETDWSQGELSGLNDFEMHMQALFRHITSRQILALQDNKDKRMHQKVEEKIQTFLNDHSQGGMASRDEAGRLLQDIESDLEGDDTVRMYIMKTCVELRRDHNLTEDLTDAVRDFPSFTTGLDILQNAGDYAYEKADLSVVSLKKNKTERLPLQTEIIDSTKPAIDTTIASTVIATNPISDDLPSVSTNESPSDKSVIVSDKATPSTLDSPLQL